MAFGLRKRTQYLIDRRFQLAFLIYSFCIALVTGALFYIPSFHLFTVFQNLIVQNGLEHSPIISGMLDEMKDMARWTFLFSAIVSFLVVFGAGLLLSHRVAGPLYRLRVSLDELKRREARRIKFRKGDFFADLADSFNDVLDAYGVAGDSKSEERKPVAATDAPSGKADS